MKKLIPLLIIIFSLVFTSEVIAQEKTVSGTVTATDQTPLPGVNVVIQGTTKGSQTDFDGKYTIDASNGDVLVFSFIGMKTKTVTIADSFTINVVLLEDAQSLDEVIITALGIKKEKKSLTYSAQEIKSDELTRVKDANPINNLSGKIAGLNVNRSSAGAGGSVKVVIRGNSSTRNNQPLYVIDGVPISNNSSSQPNSIFGDFNGGNRDGGDAISLINPDDIESMTVLKGASASALYGSQGANGVILITTKKGTSDATIVRISSNTTFEKVADLPDFQTQYMSNPGSDTSWGANSSFSNYVEDFFETGSTQISSVSLSAGNEKSQTYLSYANTNVQGVIPTNTLNKHNFNLRETAKFFNDKLDVNASITLSTQKITNKPVNGLYFNPLTGLYLGPRDGNFSDYKTNFEVLDPSRNLMAQNWPTDRDIMQNPFWILNRNTSIDKNEHVLATISLSYPVNDWLSLRSRMSYDKLFNTFDKKIFATTQATLSHTNGRYILDKSNDTQMYADFIATINKKVNDDLEINANIGTSVTNYRIGDRTFLDSGVSAGLGLANWFTLANFNSTVNINQSLASKKEVQSLFGNIQFGYKGMLYADITARNDWSSSLVNTDNLSFFYPSFGLTGVISEMVELPEAISFGKVRISYAEVGNDIPSFITSPQNTIGGGTVSGASIGPRPGESLQPEKQTSFEFGTEWRFFENRLGLELTYYNSDTKNQFMVIPAPATNPFGYSNYAFNAGNINNTGVELALTAKPIVSEDFNWNTSLNFATNKNKVTELPNELGGRVVLTDAGVNHYRYVLEEGEAFGIIEGKKLVRDSQGRIQLDADGKLQVGDWEAVGNSNPDFTLGWSNSFNYKNFSLDFHIDGRFGGEVMSITEAMMDQFGTSQRTADARNAGGVTINAVDASGNAVTTFDTETYYSTIGGRAGATGEYMYKATNISLRELAFGYNFNLKDTSLFKAVSVSMVGRNLFFLYKDAPFDPNISLSTGEGLQGVDVFGMPSTRSLGLNINLTF
ncbi:MAG: SusC/RagA family TonB-linked outer membrane protein [Lutibacter sp.]|uniref:SusC/RagA family TonB-linked outer membrane protein n=1 Tax=Lutibacter sp. TaxID=1925666 RepID=UPI003859AEB2